ncbi:hypothetical protein SPRG_21122 [Saprolegnia parasitica CBS 223.65]|uniref:Uncharacterized protein n=1 Tax=Saprolegnia parasitica (strain CBS 223.65) TaxID=695850 RepID=A0A067C7X1_SAPPC|nr:hypothetical protein SPRG_21122 [Saprolegnia parasitica CBS 223.65]KDO22636.1 hypothetical protein SPRG_21122 [Saprolegnia parasitica CBS 223.65]|eukprot:XP_012206671.1 hypothetical protein SPRG_21122 [Saprolegnia parasitica CBS 223.65]
MRRQGTRHSRWWAHRVAARQEPRDGDDNIRRGCLLCPPIDRVVPTWALPTPLCCSRQLRVVGGCSCLGPTQPPRAEPSTEHGLPDHVG